MAFALKDTPTLPVAESRKLVADVIRTPLSDKRRETLQHYAQAAKAAYSKPNKG